MERANSSVNFPNNPYQDLIDLDSDSDSPREQPSFPIQRNGASSLTRTNNHQNSFMSSTVNNHRSSHQYQYEDVSCFRSLKRMSSLDRHYFQLKQFLERRSLNILFIFGPSGCGKTLLTEHTLNLNAIPFEWASPRVSENEEGDIFYQDIFSMLDEVFGSNNIIRDKVVIFKQFPLPMNECGTDYLEKFKRFRDSIHRQITQINNHNKTIFILNSQIYSSFSILSENSEEKSLARLPNVHLIKMEGYGARQMKSIIEHFVTSYHVYSSTVNSPTAIQQVTTEANGDARKALHLIYSRKIKQTASTLTFSTNWENRFHSVRQRPEAPALIKEKQKVTIFHMLGKFLYGKRKNINFNPKSRVKAQKELSCYYDAQELLQRDPPFYFQPTDLLARSHMSLPVFSELLYENFINRFGNISDIAKMSEIFVFYDSYLSASLSRYQLMNEMQQILGELHTWGILIYNRHTIRDGKMYRIQRSKNIMIKRLINKKIEILRSYYTKNEDSGRYRLNDIKIFALMTKNGHRNSYVPLHQMLVELLTDSRRVINSSSELKAEISVIQDEEEDTTREGCTRVATISQQIVKQLAKRDQIRALVMEDSDESDIDSDK